MAEFKFKKGDRVRMTADFLAGTLFATGHSLGTVTSLVEWAPNVLMCRVKWDTGPVKSALINQKHLEAAP